MTTHQNCSHPTCSTLSTTVDSTTPPGTNLQLVEDDDVDTQPEQVANDVIPSSEQSRRYPLRTSRRRPARYSDGYN